MYCKTINNIIIGEDLFGEIGELKKIAKINLHQMNNILRTSPFFQYYRQIKSSPNCDIFKTAKYNSHQHFLFYSSLINNEKVQRQICLFWTNDENKPIMLSTKYCLCSCPKNYTQLRYAY